MSIHTCSILKTLFTCQKVFTDSILEQLCITLGWTSFQCDIQEASKDTLNIKQLVFNNEWHIWHIDTYVFLRSKLRDTIVMNNDSWSLHLGQQIANISGRLHSQIQDFSKLCEVKGFKCQIRRDKIIIKMRLIFHFSYPWL